MLTSLKYSCCHKRGCNTRWQKWLQVLTIICKRKRETPINVFNLIHQSFWKLWILEEILTASVWNHIELGVAQYRLQCSSMFWYHCNTKFSRPIAFTGHIACDRFTETSPKSADNTFVHAAYLCKCCMMDVFCTCYIKYLGKPSFQNCSSQS